MFIRKKKKLVVYVCIFSFLLLGMSPLVIDAAKDEEGTPLSYTILNEEVSDTPEKTMVVQTIHVKGTIAKDPLKELLKTLYNETRDRTDFEHHPSPTNIKIYAFASADKADPKGNDWIARAIKGRFDMKPHITINASALRALVAPASKKKSPKSETAQKKPAKPAAPQRKIQPALELSEKESLSNEDLQKVLYYEEALYGNVSSQSMKSYKAQTSSAQKERNKKALKQYNKAKKFFSEAQSEENPELYKKALRKANEALETILNMGEKEKYDELSTIIESCRSFLNKQKIKKQK